MAVKPFKLVNSKTEKDKARYALPREVGGIQWAECQANIGGDYGFKADSFSMKVLWATGIVDQAQHKWIICNVSNWEDLFEIQHQRVTGKNEKGFNQYEANPEQKEVTDKWLADGSLIALCVDGIKQLEYIAEFTVNKLWFSHTGYDVYLKNEPDKATFDFVASAIAEAQDSSFEFNLLKHNKIPEFKKFRSENSWFNLLWEEELLNDPEFLEYTHLKNLIDDVVNVETVEGLVSQVSITGWSAPEVKALYTGRGGGGGKGQTEKEVIADRVAYITAELGIPSISTIAEQYGNELSPVQVDVVMSIALGTTWSNRHYSGTFTNRSTKKAEENGKAESSPTEETTEKKTEPVVEQIVQQEQAVKSDTTATLGNILRLIDDPDRTFPKELSMEFLRNQTSEWLELFWSFCNGKIVSPQGEKTPFAKNSTRAMNTWIKLRLPESNGVDTLTEDNLRTILAHKDFVTAEIESLAY